MNSEHWRSPLSSADPAVVEKSLDGMRTSLRNAKLWGADTVLLVPAVVNPETTYAQAWERSQRQIRKLIPLAEESKVIIGIEEVWNKFLLSPLEFARYVDEFKSPWIRAYFDIGNVAIQGYPQDWIRTLGKRIVKLHFKDFSFKKRMAEFTPLLEGEIDWRAVHAALADIGFQGTATVELSGGDAGLPERGQHALRKNSRRAGLKIPAIMMYGIPHARHHQRISEVETAGRRPAGAGETRDGDPVSRPPFRSGADCRRVPLRFWRCIEAAARGDGVSV